jgi:hypothetical protein
MASVRGLLNIQSLNELTYEKEKASRPGITAPDQRPSPRSPKDRTESQKSSTSWERTGERIYRGERCEEVSMFISRPSSLT